MTDNFSYRTQGEEEGQSEKNIFYTFFSVLFQSVAFLLNTIRGFLLGTILLITLSEGTAQEKKTTNIRSKPSYLPTGIRLGMDLIPLIRIPIAGGFTGWEAYADIDFHRFFLVVEIGNGNKTYMSSSQDYASRGYYFRLGANISLSQKHGDIRLYYIGLRYGHATFSERLTYTTVDPTFGTIKYTVQESSLTMGWAEIVAGLQFRVWKGMWMGLMGRIKLLPTSSLANQIEPFEVPGFGDVTNKFSWGFSYHLSWRFAFKNANPHKIRIQ